MMEKYETVNEVLRVAMECYAMCDIPIRLVNDLKISFEPIVEFSSIYGPKSVVACVHQDVDAGVNTIRINLKEWADFTELGRRHVIIHETCHVIDIHKRPEYHSTPPVLHVSDDPYHDAEWADLMASCGEAAHTTLDRHVDALSFLKPGSKLYNQMAEKSRYCLPVETSMPPVADMLQFVDFPDAPDNLEVTFHNVNSDEDKGE